MRTELLIFLMVIFCSCDSRRASDSGNSDSVIEIDLLSEPGSKMTKLSEFAANIEYIPLQTTESSLIGPFVLKIVNIDNRIYIKNSGLEGEILCFNIDGKFLFKLQNKGRGPEEYTSISDFDVSSDNKIMTILSSSNHKLLIYKISDVGFTFQKSITLKNPTPYSVSMVPETENAFLAIPPWIGTEPTLSLLINTVGDTIHFKPNCYKYIRTKGGQGGTRSKEWLVYSTGNFVCFKEECSDTVFYVDAKDHSFKPRIIFDTHGTFFTPEMRGDSEKMRNNTTFIPNIFETSRYVFYWYYTIIVDQKIVNLHGFLFDKKTEIKYKLDIGKEYKIKLKDDLSGGPDFDIEFQDNQCSGGKLFSFVEAITLKKYVAGEDFTNVEMSDPKKKNELKKLTDSLNETDNPILIIITPKN
ncbi:MAG: 6-bladed beta-propeller [Bacteroidia bacterium]|nr:6-bladed beta-propeller [Bacteroidia bacterium]